MEKDKLGINNVSDDTKKSMLTRTITAIVLAVLAVPTILFGRFWFVVFVIIALFFMIHEFVNAPVHNSYGVFVHIFLYVMTFSFAFWIMLKNNLTNINSPETLFDSWSFGGSFYTLSSSGEGVASLSVSTIGVVLSIFVLFFLSITHKNFSIYDVTYLFTMCVFIGTATQALMFLRYYPEAVFADTDGADYVYNTISTSTLLFYVIIGTFGTDIGAYFTGVLFGKNKMNERISPKKTWEGFAGGVAMSFIFSLGFAMICSYTGHPILPIFDLDHAKNWVYIILFSLTMPFIASLGDFIFSAIKRHFGIKDFGTLLRGHGGVLDRLDSLLCVGLYVAILLIFINNQWNFLI